MDESVYKKIILFLIACLEGEHMGWESESWGIEEIKKEFGVDIEPWYEEKGVTQWLNTLRFTM